MKLAMLPSLDEMRRAAAEVHAVMCKCCSSGSHGHHFCGETDHDTRGRYDGIIVQRLASDRKSKRLVSRNWYAPVRTEPS
jgi:hypothetical protein